MLLDTHVNMNRLSTPFEASMGDVPFSRYPRPQLARDSFFCLNGTWQLSCRTKQGIVPVGEITVPFPPEAPLSGIGKTLEKGEEWIYERHFSLPKDFVRSRVLLHFGAVDQIAQVYVNDRCVATHEGGYLPFSCDITDVLRDNNHLMVKVRDDLDLDIPYGKQRRKRGGMWYTPVSGIWQTVWCESVPASAITSLRVDTTLDCVTLKVCGGVPQKRLEIDGETAVDFVGDSITVTIDDPKCWTPETPHLYHFTLHSGEDTVRSYFALRTMSAGTVNGKERLLLNGKPYFFHGLLDQGYFSDGIYLPATEEGFEYDVRRMKALGFNMLRKHIKIEPEAFYYACDREGMVVFQDCVNNGKYHFLIDTALPTIGLRRGISHHASVCRRALFEETARDMVDHLYNHPCVCYYTVFNEGWGQYDADWIYRELKALDPSRVWDATSGWFTEKESDVQSEHIYFKPVRLKSSSRPLVLSEFGGYSCKLNDHAYNPKKTYGYRFFITADELENALETLYIDEIGAAIGEGLCAAVLTQVSDVEDETNGILTYDRQVCKVSDDRMRRIAEKLQALFCDACDQQ